MDLLFLLLRTPFAVVYAIISTLAISYCTVYSFIAIVTCNCHVFIPAVSTRLCPFSVQLAIMRRWIKCHAKPVRKDTGAPLHRCQNQYSAEMEHIKTRLANLYVMIAQPVTLVSKLKTHLLRAVMLNTALPVSQLAVFVLLGTG